MKRVSKEKSILLKDKGYDVACDARYDLDGELQENERLLDHNAFVSHGHSAPYLHSVTDWMRENGVHVCSLFISEMWRPCVALLDGNMVSPISKVYPDHDTALKAGIVNGLKYLP